MLNKKWLIVALLAGMADLSIAAPNGKYAIDPTHTFPTFEFSHMNLSKWRGRFDKTSGTIVIDQARKTGTVDIVVEAGSISFGLDAMDEKAKSADFFDVEKFPKATYKGTIQLVDNVPKTIEGQITLLGVTKPLTLNIATFNCTNHPVLKKEVCGADVEGDLNWSEYGMKWSKFGQGDAGKTHLRIQVEGIRQ